MRILLLQPAIEDFYTTPIRFYPLGLLYAAAALQEAGHEISIVDALSPLKKRTLPLPRNFYHMHPYLASSPHFFKQYYRFGREDDALLAEIRAWHPDTVGIASQFTAYYKNVHEIAGRIKGELDCPIFIGGHHATTFPLECRNRTAAIDAVCAGPAESGLQQIRDREGRALIAREIDWRTLMPAHDLVDADLYRIGRKRYASLLCSRGCPHGCAFCGVERMFGRAISYRPVERVIEEMRFLYDQRGVRVFNFEDDNLTYRREWFQALLHQVIADPRFGDCELTAMNGLCYPTLDETTLGLMKQAGFKRLNLSYVTQDPELRRTYLRPGKGDELEEVVRRAQQLGLFVTVYIIIGLPGQSYPEVRESIDHLLALGVLVGPSIFYIPPGAPLYTNLELPAETRADWDLYRSTAFALETEQLSRAQLVELFSYVREENLRRRLDRK
jgi:radical SAM superfamily enzyme YgiQ (UPF0313 family)